MTSGFVAGTLVHTDKGLVPIQTLKVGDMVLSKDKSGEGETEYKPILSTFKSPVKEKIYKVEYFNETAESDYNANGLSYIFCTANHLFWLSKQATVDINESLQGEWTVSEKLKKGYLSSLHGDTLKLMPYPVLPVRTLPNFPEGCAYTQHILNKRYWNQRKLDDLLFVRFADDYQLLALSNEPKSTELKQFNKEYSLKIKNPVDFQYTDTNTLVDPILFETLAMRMIQDTRSQTHTKEKFWDNAHKPLRGRKNVVLAENKISNLDAFNLFMLKIEQFGDCTGLTEESLHDSMLDPTDVCPNPYEAYVYNIEVADHHTYFVGYNGGWVHDINNNDKK